MKYYPEWNKQIYNHINSITKHEGIFTCSYMSIRTCIRYKTRHARTWIGISRIAKWKNEEKAMESSAMVAFVSIRGDFIKDTAVTEDIVGQVSCTSWVGRREYARRAHKPQSLPYAPILQYINIPTHTHTLTYIWTHLYLSIHLCIILINKNNSLL